MNPERRPMSVFVSLNNLKNMSHHEKTLCDYFKSKGIDVCSRPITEIASDCGVSHASVTRFVKRCGYETLREFKLALAKEQGITQHVEQDMPVDISMQESSEETAQKLSLLAQASIVHTANKLDHKALEKFKHTLLKARRIFFIGLGKSRFIAEESAYKFRSIGLDVRSVTEAHEMAIQSSLVGKGDVFCAFSSSGMTVQLLDAVERAKQSSAKVLAVCANPNSALTKSAHFSLIFNERESLISSGSIYSKLAVVFLIDLVYTEVCKELGQQAMTIKQKTSQAIKELDKATGKSYSERQTAI